MTPEQKADSWIESEGLKQIPTVSITIMQNAMGHGLDVLKEVMQMSYLAGAKDKWVKVSERLPENTQDVIVCTDKGNVYANRLIGLDWALYLRNDSKITHWMPLPTPPQD